MENEKLYCVTSGSWDSYGIVAIFNTKELAEKFRDSFNKKPYADDDDEIENFRGDSVNEEIKEMPLNPNKEELLLGFKAYNLEINKQGETKNVEQAVNPIYLRNCGYYTYPYAYGEPIEKKEYMFVSCYAKDENHAIEIANKKRLEILEKNIWGVEDEFGNNKI